MTRSEHDLSLPISEQASVLLRDTAVALARAYAENARLRADLAEAREAMTRDQCWYCREAWPLELEEVRRGEKPPRMMHRLAGPADDQEGPRACLTPHIREVLAALSHQGEPDE
jgi:hypothetical protein